MRATRSPRDGRPRRRTARSTSSARAATTARATRSRPAVARSPWLPEPIDLTADPTIGVERDEAFEQAVRTAVGRLSAHRARGVRAPRSVRLSVPADRRDRGALRGQRSAAPRPRARPTRRASVVRPSAAASADACWPRSPPPRRPVRSHRSSSCSPTRRSRATSWPSRRSNSVHGHGDSRVVEPMLATLSDERELSDGWMLERKLDGVRCLAFVQGGAAALRSRNRLPLAFPTIAQALEPLGDAIVDGEIVAVAATASHWDSRRCSVTAPPRCGRSTCSGSTARICAAGRSANGTPPSPRRLRPARRCRSAPRSQGRARTPMRARARRGWEGLIAKRTDAPYRRRPLARLAQAQVRARAGGRHRRLHRARAAPAPGSARC